MSLAPLLDAPLAIQIHAFTVLPAALLGGAMLLARKGTTAHKTFGRLWIALMVVTALSSFFIHTINTYRGFSPIHLLSIVTLISCGVIIWSARTRRIAVHRTTVKSLYFGGIGLAGLFTLAPGRIMNEVVFGDLMSSVVAEPPAWLWTVFALGFGLLFAALFVIRGAAYLRRRRAA